LICKPIGHFRYILLLLQFLLILNYSSIYIYRYILLYSTIFYLRFLLLLGLPSSLLLLSFTICNLLLYRSYRFTLHSYYLSVAIEAFYYILLYSTIFCLYLLLLLRHIYLVFRFYTLLSIIYPLYRIYEFKK
jgi:hypothetical protein